MTPTPPLLISSTLVTWSFVVAQYRGLRAIIATTLLLVGAGPRYAELELAQLVRQQRRTRRNLGRTCGLPGPSAPMPRSARGRRSHRLGARLQLLGAAQTWALLRWGTFAPAVAGAFAFAPLGLLGWALECIIIRPALFVVFGVDPTGWLGHIPIGEVANLWLGAAFGLGLTLLALLPGRGWIRLSARVSHHLIGANTRPYHHARRIGHPTRG